MTLINNAMGNVKLAENPCATLLTLFCVCAIVMTVANAAVVELVDTSA